MFENTKAFSGFSVNDLEAAKKFYGEALGLKTSEQYGLLTLHLAGGRDTLVYPKPDHQPATYTILNFAVDDIDAAVDELARRGVHLERYEGLGQDDKGINRAGGPYIAWFKDPAGNVLAVLQERLYLHWPASARGLTGVRARGLAVPEKRGLNTLWRPL